MINLCTMFKFIHYYIRLILFFLGLYQIKVKSKLVQTHFMPQLDLDPLTLTRERQGVPFPSSEPSDQSDDSEGATCPSPFFKKINKKLKNQKKNRGCLILRYSTARTFLATSLRCQLDRRRHHRILLPFHHYHGDLHM